ncbi:MAG: hypothetical protein LBF68_04955 [Christensenellaceae bacterium]|jgi:hypothetical protein|nr:hypothetical protein [Christensenellaceae bacterium]
MNEEYARSLFPYQKTKEEIALILEHLKNKDSDWVTALWELVYFLCNVEFMKKHIQTTHEKTFDASTDIFLQLKLRIDCTSRTKKDGTIVTPTPIQDIPAYVFFSLPKRFATWIEKSITADKRANEVLPLEIFCKDDDKYKMNPIVSQKAVYEIREDSISRSDMEARVLDWLAKASSPIEWRQRHAKLRAKGWNVKDGILEPLSQTEKEMSRELAILENKTEILQANENRRVNRISYLRNKLYDNQ